MTELDRYCESRIISHANTDIHSDLYKYYYILVIVSTYVFATYLVMYGFHIRPYYYLVRYLNWDAYYV